MFLLHDLTWTYLLVLGMYLTKKYNIKHSHWHTVRCHSIVTKKTERNINTHRVNLSEHLRFLYKQLTKFTITYQDYGQKFLICTFSVIYIYITNKPTAAYHKPNSLHAPIQSFVCYLSLQCSSLCYSGNCSRQTRTLHYWQKWWELNECWAFSA